jgi:hypothetical protein
LALKTLIDFPMWVGKIREMCMESPKVSSPTSRQEGGAQRIFELREFLEREIWSQIPSDLRGKGISKREREEILGYGPEGV